MGKKRGSPQVTTMNQQTAPWDQQIPYLTRGFGEAAGQLNRPQTFYPYKDYASFHPRELEAMVLGDNRARYGSPSTHMARDYAMGILNNDPKAMMQTLGPRVGELLPGLQSQFNRAGMGTSTLARGAEQELIMRELSKLRESAADRLERMGPREYEDIAKLAAIGEAQRDMEQADIDWRIRKHQFEQGEPAQRLAQYMGAITGNYGGTTTGSDSRYPMPGSRLSGVLGGGLGGASLGGMVGGPVGAGIGGILGGIGGLF